MKTDFKTDVVFSVGLIEHFNKEGTRKAVEAHFELVKDGGTVILFFPTPTLLYGFTRFLAELFRLWIFHDERPLRNEEVESYIEKYGTVIHRETIWPIFLTQSVLVVRKK
jgi:cyclopropane fatty-acyl-phospholipid synthase-like methyltransferase